MIKHYLSIQTITVFSKYAEIWKRRFYVTAKDIEFSTTNVTLKS